MPSIISLASNLKNVVANGDSIAKVSLEGWECRIFAFFAIASQRQMVVEGRDICILKCIVLNTHL